MARIKRATMAIKRRRRMLKRTKGYLNARSHKYAEAKEAFLKAGRYAYRDRRKKKGEFRALWQIRINAAVREYGLSYSKFIGLLKKEGVELDRKVLAALAMDHPKVFKAIVDLVTRPS